MPLSYEDEIEIRREAVLELASKGWMQQQIAQKLDYSQAQISKDLAVIRSRAREQLTNHYQELPMRYRMVLSNLEAIRKEAWQTVAHTQDARSKSVLFNTLIAVNREIMDVIAAGDLIEQEVANAELIAKEAKEDLQITQS
jgi:transcriptional regulator